MEKREPSYTVGGTVNWYNYYMENIYYTIWKTVLRFFKKLELPYCCCSVVSHVQFFAISWTVACRVPLSSTVSGSFLKFMSIELMMLSNHLIFCLPLLLLPFTSLLFLAICKASSEKHFAFLHFSFFGMVLVTTSYTMVWTSVHSSSGTLSIRFNPLNLFVTSTV